MPRRTVVNIFVVAAVAGASMVSAQQPPPVRPLGPIERVSMERLASVSGARHLPAGRVIVNDMTGHRVMLFDSTLSLVKIIADSTPSTNKAYGRSVGNLIAYHGDSTLFVDRRGATAPGPITASAPGRAPIRQPPDSAPLVRDDLVNRTKDTVALYRITSVVRAGNTTDNAENFAFHVVANPLPLVDDWAVLSDATIAIIRGRDYHIDWLHTDGTRTSSPRIPFDWKHLTDGDIWIRSSKLAKGQPVYDIIDARGELIDRVQLPPFRTIAGFGPGVVYMGVLDSAKVAHLERARVK